MTVLTTRERLDLARALNEGGFIAWPRKDYVAAGGKRSVCEALIDVLATQPLEVRVKIAGELMTRLPVKLERTPQ